RSGGFGEHNRVDPWSHFVNAYVLDKDGQRIARRNAEDIFVALYSHQIPPGAADAIHYKLKVPEDARGPLRVEARLQYRKFDTTYMQFVKDDPNWTNDLPVMLMATDQVRLPVRGGPSVTNPPSTIPEWQRWNDYGIGLLRKGGKSKGELRQAEQAFSRVEELGRPDGPVNLARVYLAQGTVQDRAISALERAATFDPPAPPWSVAWFTGLVNKQNGFLDEAIANFEGIVALDDEETRRRGFDFSKDYRLLNELGQTLYERARQERGEAKQASRRAFIDRAKGYFERTLELDPENSAAHYNLYLLHKELDLEDQANVHFDLYRKYKVDDNARDRAVAIARAADPAADHAAEAIVIYDLQRPGTFELDTVERGVAAYELPVPKLAEIGADAPSAASAATSASSASAAGASR
ncbi:MAG: tetratricopeptide repeat protein, partial [Acidobacteriota bacterium]